MKKLLPFILFLVLLLPNVASAHADLVSSQPKDGATVQQPLSTLTLHFGEDVEKFMSFTLTNTKGETFAVTTPKIQGKTAVVTVKKPLTNGEYTAKWNVVAVDGHETPGELSFNVGKVEKNAQSQTPSQSTAQNPSPTKSNNHQTLYISIIVILAVVIVIALFTVFRKKGK